MNEILLFENQEVRRVWVEEEQQWYFVVIDIIALLTDSSRPRKYWSDLKSKEKKNSGVQLSELCGQLKVQAKDGKSYKTDCASKENLFRIIQSIPSPKAEPFKIWLANVGAQHIDEKTNKRLAARRKLQESEEKFFQNAKQRGVDEEGVSRILKEGDKSLFDGKDIHGKYGISEEDNINDYMRTLLLKGKDLAVETTDFNMLKKALEGELDISDEHKGNSKAIREYLIENTGIKPEDIPPEEDIKKLKGKIKNKQIKSTDSDNPK
ncbi:BRO family protein [Flexithrix dorotheae]|uniref:BRO family protein n=1 Tax=Flexithrix dorotheae TaxID=70993 RepID=UPI0003683792|nr:BRO family protein [Flexithrix dorotheae]